MVWLRRIILLAVALMAGFGIWKKDELLRLRATITLFDEGRITHNFSHMGEIFHARPIPVSGRVDPLPEGTPMVMPKGWKDWTKRRAATAAIVVKDGEIVHESYYRGTGRDDQRISWSMAKSYLSAIYGTALANGEIDDLDDPVTKYVPALIDSAYDGSSIRNVLHMSSGVKFDEDYLDFWSDINKMGRVLALGRSMDDFATALTARRAAPGQGFKYVSIDTHVLAMVLRSATGRSLPDLMAERLMTPMGTYGAPHYLTDGEGVAFALGGLNLTTRDYARMGELYRNDGAFGGAQIIPADWVRESTTASAKTRPGQWRYGYQWWLPGDGHEGEFLARGVYGQYVYIDRSRGVVIAINAVDRNFKEDGASQDAIDMMRAIATAANKE